MTAQKLNTQIRKEQIIQTALSLVASNGLKGLSMEKVARKVGFVPSAIYRHFNNKNEMLDAVLEFIGISLVGNVEAACKESSDPLERLRLLLTSHVKLIRENQAIPLIIFSEEVYSESPQRKERIHRMLREYVARISDIIKDGQKSGQIRPDIDPGTVSVLFLGIIQPAAILWHVSNNVFDVTKHAKKAWLIFSEAIKT